MNNEIEKSAPKGDPWRFSFDLIGWGPAVSGDVTVRGHNANVDESLDDLLDDLKGIAMLGFELRKEKFGFYAQPNWIKLEEDAQRRAVEQHARARAVDCGCGRLLSAFKSCEEKPLTLDAGRRAVLASRPRAHREGNGWRG